MISAAAVPLPRDPSRGEVPELIVKLTNAERARAGLAPLRTSTRLMRAAQLHADQASGAGRLEHVLPGTPHPRPEDRLAAVGYDWQASAENVAFGHSTPSRAVASWMRSAGHRKNLLSRAYIETGTGYALDRRGRPYFVQVFARPRRKTP